MNTKTINPTGTPFRRAKFICSTKGMYLHPIRRQLVIPALFLTILSLIASPTAIHAALPNVATAPEVGKTAVPPQTKKSFLDPIEGFVRDSILRPKTPFELVPNKDPNDWGFVIEPYLWAIGIQGQTGVGGLPPVNVNVSSKNLLQHLDWGLMGMGEIRKGRWGVLGDGYYAALSASGDLGGVLYKDGSLQMQQALASLSIAYRIIDDRRGFLDLYAGARYNYLGIQVDTTVDSRGVSSLTEGMTQRLAAGIDRSVSKVLSENPGAPVESLVRLINRELTFRTLEKIADTPSSIREALKVRDLRNILTPENAAFADYIAARTALTVAKANGQRIAALEANVAATKKKLANQLAEDIEDALPTHGAGDQWWIDPIVGLRAQINLSRWIFLAAQGDVGGFGVGSQITWNTQATIGVNFTRNVFAELGYRYMYVDYNKNDFLYQMNSYGLFSSIGVKF